MGPRLIELCETLLSHRDRTAQEIMGPVDALKLRSAATLFAALPQAPEVFQAVLETFYDGESCALTDALIGADLSP